MVRELLLPEGRKEGKKDKQGRALLSKLGLPLIKLSILLQRLLPFTVAPPQPSQRSGS